MGFLDHSTNNIIVDAVLTDIGRQQLAANDGSFRISQFALGDDEIDYGLIKKFGRNVGQEKIEKNTPVMEALTRSNLGLKYRLVSVANSYLVNFPTIALSPHENVTDGVVNLQYQSGTAADRRATLTFTVTPQESSTIDVDLRDEEFFVEVNNIFLRVLGDSPDIVNTDNTVVYRIGTTTSAQGYPVLSFTVHRKDFSQTQFDTYSITSTTTFVKTFVKVTGATSGLTKNVEVRITQS